MNSDMLRLGVNVDHVATLREARGTPYPDVLEAARLCTTAGAKSITVHLRQDRRHIKDRDIYVLKETLRVPMNLEMANNAEIVEIALDVCPDEVCLVPEKREELTTEGGLDAAGQTMDLDGTVKALKDRGIVVSLFIDPDKRQIEAAAVLGAPCIEMHTGTFCNASGAGAELELDRLISGAACAHDLQIQVNAGHGLNLENIEHILEIPYLDTLNIGHSIVSRAVFVGMENAVKEMLNKMKGYTGGRHG